MAMNLDAQNFDRLKNVLHGRFDGIVIPWVKSIYDAAACLGDNPVALGVQEKCNNIQRIYNEQAVPKIEAANAEATKLSDFAERMATMQANTDITTQIAGEVKTGAFDAALDL